MKKHASNYRINYTSPSVEAEKFRRDRGRFTIRTELKIAPEGVRRVLVYRLGSIGDTVVALPCFHLVRRRFPQAEIAVVTNQPVESRAAPMASVLHGTGLVDKYIGYRIKTRHVAELLRLRRAIVTFAPDLLIYLSERTKYALVLRDWIFFYAAGVTRTLGFPFTQTQRQPQAAVAGSELWESEASRLARCISELGPADIGQPANWDLCLSAQERAEASRLLEQRMPYGRAVPKTLMGVSIGTKQPSKEWGDRNWRETLSALTNPTIGLVLIGGSDERERSQEIARGWPGHVINLCGRATPRVSAAVIERLMFLLCPDSGPMHLAAAVGTRCIAVFSRHNLPGQWFPFGSGHRVLYPYTRAIAPETVVAAAREFLAASCEAIEAHA